MSADVVLQCLTAAFVAIVAWDAVRRAVDLKGARDAKALVADLRKAVDIDLDRADEALADLEEKLGERISGLEEKFGGKISDLATEIDGRLSELGEKLEKRGEQVDKLRFAVGEKAQSLTTLSHRNRGSRGQTAG